MLTNATDALTPGYASFERSDKIHAHVCDSSKWIFFQLTFCSVFTTYSFFKKTCSFPHLTIHPFHTSNF